MEDDDLKRWRYTHFSCFARTGRWGTCGDCPRNLFDQVYPEFCDNTFRYDHQLDLEALVERLKRRMVCAAKT